MKAYQSQSDEMIMNLATPHPYSYRQRTEVYYLYVNIIVSADCARILYYKFNKYVTRQNLYPHF